VSISSPTSTQNAREAKRAVRAAERAAKRAAREAKRPTRRELLAEIADLPDDTYISPAHAAAMLDTSTGVLLSWRDQKRGPRFHGFRQFVRYRISDLISFMAQRVGDVEAVPESILREQQVCEVTHLSHATIRRRVAAGNFPPPVKLGDGRDGAASGWLASEVVAWMRSLRREETAEPVAGADARPRTPIKPPKKTPADEAAP
jgi:prophage regulatory protein